MTIVKTWKEKGYFIDLHWMGLFWRSVPSLLLLAVRHPRLVKTASRTKEGQPINLRPDTLPYKIPDYKKGMKTAWKDERFLRPTYLCDPRKKEIIALAHELGAFEVSDFEFATRAHRYVNKNIRIDFSAPKSEVETLFAGHGTCIDKMNLFDALCRTAGIPARYHLYSFEGVESLYDIYISADPLVKKWYDSLGFFFLHGNPEAFVDGKWQPCDVSVDIYHLVTAGHPITRFGEDPTKTMMRPTDDSLHLEGLPIGFKQLGGLPFVMFKGTGQAINTNIDKNYERGKELLGNQSLEEYDAKARKTYRPKWHDSGNVASNILKKL